jgi:hypothetical protein
MSDSELDVISKVKASKLVGGLEKDKLFLTCQPPELLITFCLLIRQMEGYKSKVMDESNCIHSSQLNHLKCQSASTLSLAILLQFLLLYASQSVPEENSTSHLAAVFEDTSTFSVLSHPRSVLVYSSFNVRLESWNTTP